MAVDPILGNFSLTVLIVADLVVCALILIYMFQDRRRDRKPIDADGLRNLIDSLSAVIKESDRASKNLLDALGERHRRTTELLDEMDVREARLKKAVRKTEELLLTAKDSGMTDEYAEVSRFADLGMEVEEIARRVKLPKGEIELVLGLKR